MASILRIEGGKKWSSNSPTYEIFFFFRILTIYARYISHVIADF